MSGLDNLRARLNYAGADPIGRMNNAKARSLQAALKDSYQSASIQRVWDGKEFQCLINPDRLKPDYDNKIISVPNNAAFRAGDTFHWPSNDTFWLVYLQELTETAYYRAYIRRCRYKLTIDNSDYYVYIQGPTETNIRWNQKAGVSWNQPNYGLVMYIARTAESLAYLERFKTINLDGHTWRVEAVDSLSIEGLLEVNLSEFFENSLEDLQTIPEVVIVDVLTPHIVGDVFVRPYDTKTYTVALASDGTWALDSPKAKINSSTSDTAEVEVISGKSGTFTLTYLRPGLEDLTALITIESI